MSQDNRLSVNLSVNGNRLLPNIYIIYFCKKEFFSFFFHIFANKRIVNGKSKYNKSTSTIGSISGSS